MVQHCGRYQTSAYIVCIEYTTGDRQPVKLLHGEDKRARARDGHHTAAVSCTLCSRCRVDIVYSRHVDCYSPTETVSTLEPKYAWRCHQGTGEVDAYSAYVKETRSHTLFGIIVHRQGIVKINTQVLYGIVVSCCEPSGS